MPEKKAKMKNHILIVSVLFVASVFCAASFSEVPDGVYANFKSPQRIIYEEGTWTYEFDVRVNISPDGRASASIENLNTRVPGAWARLKVTAEVFKVNKRDNPGRIRAQVRIKAVGRSRSFFVPLPSMGDYSKYEWTGESDKDSEKEWTKLFILMIKDHPELEEIDDFTLGGPDEVSEEWEVTQAAAEEEEAEIPIEERSLVHYVEGEVFVKKSDGTVVEAAKDMILGVGDTVETKDDARATIILANSSVLKLRSGTVFTIPESEENNKEKVGFVKLVKGFLWARAKRDKNSLKVATPNAICGVRGTKFSISYEGGVTIVNVAEGVVWLAEEDGAKETIINAGEEGRIPEEDEVSAPSEAEEVELFQPDVQAGKCQVPGRWDTNFGDVVFEQSGSSVTGSYYDGRGKIEGQLSGNTLKGTWAQSPSYEPPGNAGDLEFVFSPDGESFTGKWRYGYGGGKWRGAWSGKKI